MQELAYALATAIAVLDAVKDAGQVSEEDFEKVVGRISFFVNAGVRFVEETCKMRAFVRLWDEITARALRRAGREDAPVPLRRAGQLARPDRGPAGEQRAADRARDARGDAVQERPRPRRTAAGVERGARACPRPWDQQWSLRLQQVLAFESDLLEYDDIFEGSHVIEAKVAELVDGGARGDRPGAGDGRGDRGRRVRLHEAGAGQLALRAPRRGSRTARRRSSASTCSRPPSRRRSPPTSTPRSRPPTRRPSGRDRRPGGLEAQRDQAEVDDGAAPASPRTRRPART